MPKHTSQVPRITDKEKNAPAYRKKIEADNTQLKNNLENIQNQSSVLQQKCSELEKDNSVLNERIRGSGLSSTVKDICLLIGGTGISYFIEKQYYTASTLLLVTFTLIGLYWLLNNFNKR